MKSRAPLQRLSVEERVNHAVQAAVRRALDKQRRAQERELDTLSDALQRSLAALAGERDRALRGLAAEEEKRCQVVDDVSRLLGDELTGGDVSRITMGLEVLEREQQEQKGGEEWDGPYGRAWLLEQLRQCLHARAAAQDHLRVAAQTLIDDRFDADSLMGLPPPSLGSVDKSGSQYHSICPPGSPSSTVKPDTLFGVTPARQAASNALMPSLELARRRVSHLESLVREVGGGMSVGARGGRDRQGVVGGKEESGASGKESYLEENEVGNARTVSKEKMVIRGGGDVDASGEDCAVFATECWRGRKLSRPKGRSGWCSRREGPC